MAQACVRRYSLTPRLTRRGWRMLALCSRNVQYARGFTDINALGKPST